MHSAHFRHGTVAAVAGLCASLALAQPQFGNPSPTAGSKTSQQANQAADQAAYQPVAYVNAGKPGPALVVIPGEIKSNNASFTSKITPNNIADFAEVELSSANFQVLERSNLGPLLREFELAYNLGDPQQARKFLGMGKLKTTKYVVKFDILKAEQIASAQRASTVARSATWPRSPARSAARGAARRPARWPGAASARCSRTRRPPCGWSACATRSSMPRPPSRSRRATPRRRWRSARRARRSLGVSQSQQGGVGIDTMVQRLVQKSVWEIDSKYK